MTEKELLYSFIYVELYNLTILGKMGHTELDSLQGKIRKAVNDNFKQNFPIVLDYNGVGHGGFVEWIIFYKKRIPFKVKPKFTFDLYDGKYSEHKKNLRSITIDKILQ